MKRRKPYVNPLRVKLQKLAADLQALAKKQQELAAKLSSQAAPRTDEEKSA